MKRDFKKIASALTPPKLAPPNRTLILVCLILAALNVDALEISREQLRLSLHEKSGRFSLYGMNKDGRFEPFFSDTDPRTSFIELNVSGRLYRLGDSSAFRVSVDSAGEAPALVFESDDLQVREEFSFIKTPGSSADNGVRITVRLRNRLKDPVTAGLRVLLDSSLGEGRGQTPFFINEQGILAETLISGSVVLPWVSRSSSFAIMGSVGGPEAENPDYLQFANWKRLSETSWRPALNRSRDFNYPPYSFNDAALCYYYEPRPLPAYGELHFVLLLAAEDAAGFTGSAPEPEASSGEGAEAAGLREADLARLRSLISRMNYYLEGKIEIPGEELSAMEAAIARLRAHYGAP